MTHVEPVAYVSNSSAVSAINTYLEWADQVDIPLPEKMILRKLRDKSFYFFLPLKKLKYWKSLKKFTECYVYR